MSEVVTGVNGRALSRRGLETRQRLLEAAERVFGDLGYHDASIVKITEAAGVAHGTFYLYFGSKQEIFDELVRDLSRRIRHTMTEAAAGGATRYEQELRGFRAFFDFAVEHSGLYKIIRQAAFVSPDVYRWHYETLTERYAAALRDAVGRHELGPIDPEVAAWALGAIGETIGMRWILWGDGAVPDDVLGEVARIVRAILEPAG